MPSRARLWAGRSSTDEPRNTTDPLSRGRSPIRLFIKVDLPTPLRPMTATISPSRTLMSTP